VTPCAAGLGSGPTGENARQVGRGIYRHHRGRARDSDQRTAKGGPEDPRGRVCEAVQRVRVAELTGRGHLDRQRGEGGREERRARPAQPGEQDEQPQRRAAREQRRGQADLRAATEHIRAEHRPAPSEPVGDHAGKRHEQHLGNDVSGEHPPKAGRVGAAFQYRKRDGHG
jgi:hypothetical protein